MTDFDSEFQELAGWSDERLTSELAEAARNERTSLVALLLRAQELLRHRWPKGDIDPIHYVARLHRSRLPRAIRILQRTDLRRTARSRVWD